MILFRHGIFTELLPYVCMQCEFDLQFCQTLQKRQKGIPPKIANLGLTIAIASGEWKFAQTLHEGSHLCTDHL